MNNKIYDGISLPKSLPDAKILEYFKCYKNGDLNAREIIIEHNLRLVSSIVAKYFNSTDFDADDLMSIGSEGLIKAVDSYDVDKKYKFSTYASRCISNEILMFLRKNNKRRTDVSLEDTLNYDDEGNEQCLEDILGTEGDLETQLIEKEEILENDSKYNRILNQMDRLPEREKQIIELYYGLNGNKKIKQHEISSMLGLSQSNVSRLYRRAVKNLKKYMEDEECVHVSKNTTLHENSNIDKTDSSKEEAKKENTSITGVKKIHREHRDSKKAISCKTRGRKAEIKTLQDKLGCTAEEFKIIVEYLNQNKESKTYQYLRLVCNEEFSNLMDTANLSKEEKINVSSAITWLKNIRSKCRNGQNVLNPTIKELKKDSPLAIAQNTFAQPEVLLSREYDTIQTLFDDELKRSLVKKIPEEYRYVTASYLGISCDGIAYSISALAEIYNISEKEVQRKLEKGIALFRVVITSYEKNYEQEFQSNIEKENQTQRLLKIKAANDK